MTNRLLKVKTSFSQTRQLPLATFKQAAVVCLVDILRDILPFSGRRRDVVPVLG